LYRARHFYDCGVEMKTIAIAMGAFLLLVGGFLTFVIIYGLDDAPTGQSGPAAPANPRNKQLEDQVLAGYEVKLWGDGRPFVNYYDPGAGEYGTQDIKTALFMQAQYGPGGEMGQMGWQPSFEYDGVEAAYRLALINEYGLFGYGVNRSEAMRYYRVAKMGGHAGGRDGEKRLQAAGEK
jgi:hypothetical protein